MNIYKLGGSKTPMKKPSIETRSIDARPHLKLKQKIRLMKEQSVFRLKPAIK